MGTSIRVADDTKADFDKLKATLAETMSADEFLRVLMVTYRAARQEVTVR